MVKVTNEILNILAKGQFKSGFNPLATISGIMEGDMKEAVLGGFDFSITTAAYAKAGKIVQKAETIEMNCTSQESAEFVKEISSKIKKRIIPLKEAPTAFPYVAYFNKGMFANPTVVVVEVKSVGDSSTLTFTAFTTKVGFIKTHSLNTALHKFTKYL